MLEEKAAEKKGFISYGHFDDMEKQSHHCSDLAFKLYDRLKAINYDPWIDKEKLEEGEDWEVCMENGLTESDAILSLMTPYSMRRPDGYCLNEIAMGNIHHKKIIPIMVRYIIPPLSIVRLQYLDFQIWSKNTPDEVFNERFEKILEVIDGRRLELKGAYTYLIRKLNPLNFEAEIDEEVQKFFGRKWIIEEVQNWLYNKEKYKEVKKSKLFLLIGDPGMGKTAISAKLCHEFPEVVAYHLNEHGNSMKSDAKECVKSLAYQLSNQIPELVDHLKAANLEDITGENALSLFDRLIIQPLHKISSPKDPKLIVIDAIDEGKKERSGGKGMENQMIDFISKLYERTPDWLKLFITTRPERYILNRLPESEIFYFNAEDKRNDEDLKGFVEKELKRIFPDVSMEKALSTIVERSEGIFLYIRLVLKDLERDPEEGILKIKDPERFPKGLTKWYLENFERQFPDIDNYNKVLRPLFELLVAAQEPLENSLIQKILNWTTYQVNEVKRSLGSLFKITYDGKIEPFHKSLYEWLTDDEATQSTDDTYWVDKESGDRTLANYGWNQYQSDIFYLPFYFFRNLVHHLSETDKISELNHLKAEINIEAEKTNISETSSQFLQYLLQYFKDKGRDDILAEYLLDCKKVSCLACKGLKLNYIKESNLYRCLNPNCEQEPFDTKIHSKFKKVFLSYCQDEIHLDLIERVKSDLEADLLSIHQTWEDPQVIIIFLSSQSIHDEKCLEDIEKARKYNLEIVTVLIDECNLYQTRIGYNLRQISPLNFQNWPLTDLEYRARYNELMDKIEEGIIIYEAKKLKNAYLSFGRFGKLSFSREVLKMFHTTFELLGLNCFIAKGQESHEKCIEHLKKSDLVIFFVFPYYGTLIKVCNLKEECKADCPMKGGTDQISFFHCEYKNTIAERIFHESYIIEKEWDAQDVPKEAFKLKDEISNGEYHKRIRNFDDPDMIQTIQKYFVDHLMSWFFEGKLDLPNFSGRREELEELLESIENHEKIEVYGVGGVGKTTLVQIALLIQRLKGKKIVTIGIKQTYATGSGYSYTTKKLNNTHQEVSIGNIISLDDVLKALSALLPDITNLNKDLEKISHLIETEDVLLFIDDAHLADDNVKDLIISTNSLVLSSRERTGLARKEINLVGLRALDSENLLDLILTKSGKNIPNWVKDKIRKITEGHPVSMDLLVRNYEIINFDKFEQFDLKNIDENQVKEYYQRMFKEIGSQEVYNLLIDLSIINGKIDTNIDYKSVMRSYDVINIDKIFHDSIIEGMLKRKEGKEGVYEFVFKHFQSALKSLANQVSHEKAIKYYQNKIEIFGDNIEDSKEIEYHRSKLNSEDN